MFFKNIFSVCICVLIALISTQVYASKSHIKYNNRHYKKYDKHKKIQPKHKKHKIPPHILKEFKKYKNHKNLLYIAKKESTFKPHAKNGHCIGLMQVNEKVWYKELKKKKIIASRQDLRSISGNIRAGDYILKHYKNNYRRYQGKK